ncbi:MAG: hypothetical protein QOD60_1873 [Solirubrobacterales bacterium]|jgi:hypothetical protein|nr:hypothetical protein [Solirubrobacterales bacterium]
MNKNLPSWSGPLIVFAIVVPTIGGFALAGPALGLVLGSVVAAAVVILAVRYEPKGTIHSAAVSDSVRHVLVVLSRPVEGTEAVEAIADAAGAGEDGELLVLAPAESTFLDRWASDLGPARAEAQRKLVISVASLAAAHLDARAQVGDASLVQAVQDTLRTFPATEVILATGRDPEDPHGARAAAELGRRLDVPFQRLVLG